MDRRTRQFVRDRAGNRCEYCGLLQKLSPVAQLQIEHIIPRKHGGGDEEHNLALACIDCNLAKSSNLAGIDPTTSQTVPLFNPRSQQWNDHFAWQGTLLVGLTPSAAQRSACSTSTTTNDNASASQRVSHSYRNLR